VCFKKTANLKPHNIKVLIIWSTAFWLKQVLLYWSSNCSNSPHAVLGIFTLTQLSCTFRRGTWMKNSLTQTWFCRKTMNLLWFQGQRNTVLISHSILGIHNYTSGSQKVRFPILLPPNNFTQWDASLFTYYTSLIFPHSHLLCWGTCLGGKSISQNLVDRRWDPDQAAMFAPHAWYHHVIWITWHEDVFSCWGRDKHLKVPDLGCRVSAQKFTSPIVPKDSLSHKLYAVGHLSCNNSTLLSDIWGLLRWTALLTFRLRHLNSVFRAHGTKYFCDSPLNRWACLTINVYKRSIEVD